MNSHSRIRLGIGHAIATKLAADPAIEAVLLFGSAVRGEAHADSDIDIAVITDGEPYSIDAVKALAPAEWADKVGVSAYTYDGLHPDNSYDWAFLVHLDHCSLRVKTTDRLEALLTMPRPSRLKLAASMNRWAGMVADPGFSYRAARRCVFLANTALGERDWNRRGVFERFATRHPELATEAAILARAAGHDRTARQNIDRIGFLRHRQLRAAQAICAAATDDILSLDPTAMATPSAR